MNGQILSGLVGRVADRGYKYRQEDDVNYLIFEPGLGRYFFGNHEAVKIVERINTGSWVDGDLDSLTESTRSAHLRVLQRLAELDIPSNDDDSVDEAMPRVWNQDEAFESERCSTFGMPL